ncbi:MAG: DUF748 domain-containing protein [Dissulfurispiraceae bacterium]|nr:DUF748 domain-containing protein [Dissulfurispiraceae bacterium]
MISRKRIKKTLIILLLLLVLFSVTGFFILPPVIKSILVNKLSETLHRSVSVESVKVNPYNLVVTIEKMVIKEQNSDKDFLSFSKLRLNLHSLSMLKSGIIVDEIYLEYPFIRVVRNENDTFNYSDLIKPDNAKKTETKKEPFQFSINNIQIAGGKVEFIDLFKKTNHIVNDIVITLPFVSNRAHYVETYIEPHFSAVLNDTLFIAQGRTKPFADSMETMIDFNVKNLDLPYYLAYLPSKPKAKIESALFSIDTKISYKQYKDKPPSFSLTGDFNLDKLVVKDGNNAEMISIPSIAINIDASDLMDRTIHISRALIDSPKINMLRSEQGINLMDLMPAKNNDMHKTEPEHKQGKETPVSSDSQVIVEASEIILKSGRIVFNDLSNKKTFKTKLENIEAVITDFSNRPDTASKYKASLQTESDEGLKLSGLFVAEPFSVEGDLSLRSIHLAKYSPYYEEGLNFDLQTGMLDLAAEYSVSEKKKTFHSISADLKTLALKRHDAEEPFISVPALSLRKGEINLMTKSLILGDVSTSQGMIKVIKSKDGRMNIQSLFLTHAPHESVSHEKYNSLSQKTNESKNKDAVSEDAWVFSLLNFKSDDYRVEFDDNSTSPSVKSKLSDISVNAKNISTKKNIKTEFRAASVVNDIGRFETSGSFGLDPLTAEAEIALHNISISPFQPYFTEKIRILVTKGDVSANGRLHGSFNEHKELTGEFSGEMVVTDFATVEKDGAADFLKWNALALSDLEVGINPNKAIINKVSLTDFYSKIVINPDGTTNLQHMIADSSERRTIKSQNSKEKSAAKKNHTEQPETVTTDTDIKKDAVRTTQKIDIKVDQITMQAGTIDFADNLIKPNYSAKLTEIGGSILGITMDSKKPADLNLRGKFDQYAPLEITGKIYPFPDDLFMNLDFKFRDMDLSPVSPYAGKYVGYNIQKGKLNFDLKYSIAKRRLEAQNNIQLDQLTLGDKIESPTATKLPVKLAIALLKNRRGEIDLDVPVSGSLDDPKFSIGSIILKVIVNLLVKAATSPFALLGALFGGGEELSYLEFEYASSSINEIDSKKLDNLIKALSDRPGLKLEIEGYADPDKDKEALLQLTFQRKLKAQKLKRLAKTGSTSLTLDEVTIDGKEYADLLKAAYREERFPKPRNIIGMVKDIPSSEMEKLILTHIRITEDDLRLLAKSRAASVKEYIIKSDKIEPQRVFLIETKSLAPEKKQKLKNSRAEFRLN